MTKTQTFSYRTVAVLAAFALIAAFAPALVRADDNNDDFVTNNNTAVVSTSVGVAATTGGNNANGSQAGHGGHGGSLSGSGDVEQSSAGNGGNGGNAGHGGRVTSGNAMIDVAVGNFVNTVETEIDRTGDDSDDDENEVFVDNTNVAVVATQVGGLVATGDNNANGSAGGNGGNGGSLSGGSDDVEGSGAGDGGHGGTAGDGGMVTSGDTEATIGVISIVNSIITRIMR